MKRPRCVRCGKLLPKHHVHFCSDRCQGEWALANVRAEAAELYGAFMEFKAVAGP